MKIVDSFCYTNWTVSSETVDFYVMTKKLKTTEEIIYMCSQMEWIIHLVKPHINVLSFTTKFTTDPTLID